PYTTLFRSQAEGPEGWPRGAQGGARPSADPGASTGRQARRALGPADPARRVEAGLAGAEASPGSRPQRLPQGPEEPQGPDRQDPGRSNRPGGAGQALAGAAAGRVTDRSGRAQVAGTWLPDNPVLRPHDLRS